MAFSFGNPRQKILQEIICLFEGSAGLAKGNEIFSLDLIQLFGITHKQPDRRVHRIFLDTCRSNWSSHLGLLERCKMAIDTSVCSSVALGLDLSPNRQAITLPILPAFEDIGSKVVKGTLPLAPSFNFVKGS